jgi:hypothetical protein
VVVTRARCRARELAEAKVLLNAEEEARTPDAAYQNSDFHIDRH